MSAVGAVRAILGLDSVNLKKVGSNIPSPTPVSNKPDYQGGKKPAPPTPTPIADIQGGVTADTPTPKPPTPIGQLPDYTDMSTKTQRSKQRTATALTSYAAPRKTLLG